jgi:hypothetical protein
MWCWESLRGNASISSSPWGAVSEKVTVSAKGAELLEPDTASLGQLIERRTIEDLPLNGRNYLTLAALAPGVIPQQGTSSFVNATTKRSERSVYVAGQRESSTSYLFDGVELRNPWAGDTSMNISPDEIQEFRVQRNFFQAEFGNAPAIINVASKSGSNQFHGSAYELLRNEKLDARNFFSPGPEPLKRNQFGFGAGGPVLRNRVFFFGNYEGMRQSVGSVQRGLYPTQRMLRGDFTTLGTIYDPLSFSAAAGTRQPFPGNVIPADRINSVSKNFFPYIPVTDNPVVQGANLTGNPVAKSDDNQETVRIDWIITSAHSLFGRQSWQNAPIHPASLVPYGGVEVRSRANNQVLQLTSTVRPTLVNVLRLSHAYANLADAQVRVNEDIAAKIGITGLSHDPIQWGVPILNWQGYSGIGSQELILADLYHNYQITDSLAWVGGNHSVKFGADVRQSRYFQVKDSSGRGVFTFRNSWTAALDPAAGNPVLGTGNAVADFLLGYPTEMLGAVGTSATHYRYYTLNLYAQDDWKITRELTINYGLRYEYVGPPSPEEISHVSTFDFRTGQQVFPVLGQVRRTIVAPDRLDFAPRLGLAYNPAWGRTWVVRAGAGVYYDQSQFNEVTFGIQNPPTTLTQSYVFSGRGLPAAQFGKGVLPSVTPTLPTPDYRAPAGAVLLAVEQDGRAPREYMWNLSVQKSLGANWLVEVAYLGSHGRRLSKRYNANADAVPGVLYQAVPGAKPYPNFSGILYTTQAGASNYNALNLRVERRFSNGFSILSAYGWAHSIDNDSGGNYASANLNPANFQLDRGCSEFDIRQRSVTSFIYELPAGKGKRFLGGATGLGQALLGNWQINGIAVLRTGLNRSVTSPNISSVLFSSQRADAAGINWRSDFSLAGATIHPGQGFDGENRSLYWLNPKAFSQTPALRFGTSGRNIIPGPSIWNWDVSLFKSFPVTEATALQFRAELFNAFNNTHFSPPRLDISSPAFGQLVSADSPRIIQLSLRLKF